MTRGTPPPRIGGPGVRLAAVLAAAWTGLAGASSALGAPPIAPATLQDPAPGTGPTRAIEATLHTRLVGWSAAPGAAVEARLERGARTVATAHGRADRDGAVRLALEAPSRGDAVLRPRDRLTLSDGDGATASAVVPDLVVSPDLAAGRIRGRAPQADAVTVTVAGDVGSPRRLEPGIDGAFELALDAALMAPGGRGWVERVDGGHRFRAEWAVMEAAVEVGTPWVSGDATPGGRIAVQRDPPSSGEPSLATVGGSGAPPTGFDVGLRGAIAAGSAIRITETLPLAPERSWRLVVPALDVALDPAGNRVVGSAPMGATVDVVLEGPGGERSARQTTAGADGRFEAILAGVGIGPGWRAAATVADADGLGARARAAIPQVRATLYENLVTGVAAPRGQAVVTLRRPGEPPKGPWRAAVAPDGAFAVELAGAADDAASPLDVLPGDSLFVDVAGGDPMVVEVPALSAIADAAADAVEGFAPPGARLRVSADIPGASPRAVSAGADGRWRASWSGEADLASGDGGVVTAVLGGGHVVQLRWAAVGLLVDVGTGELVGNAPPNRGVVVALAAADGSPLGTANARADRLDPLGRWRAEVRDALGQVVPLRAGDRLTLEVGDERLELDIPPLEGVVHVADDLVGGRTRPGARLAVSVARPDGAPDAAHAAVARLAADAAGGYAASFAPGTAAPFDIRYNDRVRLEVEDGAVRFARSIDAPGLVVDVGNGVVRGSLEPRLVAQARLERAGGAVAVAALRTGDDATFRVVLRGPGDSPPRAGDRIVVTSDGAGGARGLELVVAEHALDLAGPEGRASGRTVPGGRVRLATHHAFGAAPDSGPHDVSGADDGAWSWAAGAPLAPGTRVAARAILPSGHIQERADTVPILSVQLGSDRVCGRGAPLAPVALSARGGALAGSGRADDEGGFAIRLVAADGSPALLSTADRVEGAVGAARLAAEPRGFHATLDASGRGIQGVAEGTDRVDLFHPVDAIDCRGTAAGAPPSARDAFAPFADGRFRFIQRELATWLPEGIELAWFDRTDGQRRFWRSSPLRVYLHIHTDLVAGTVAPSVRLRVAVLGPDGAERAAGQAVGGPDGRFAARLEDPVGDAIALAVGDTVVVTLVEQPGDALALAVQRLDLDFAPGTAIVGEAPARHPVDVRLHLAGGPTVDLALVADETGGWTVDAGSIPPRAGWTLADVVGVRAELPLPGGHAVVVEAGRVDGGSATGGVLFIPAGERP